MASKELVFKVVLQADNKDYVSNVKQSDDVTKAIVASIKEEADKLKSASENTSKEVGKIVPEELKSKAAEASIAMGKTTQAAEDLDKQALGTSAKVGDLGDTLKTTGVDAITASKEIGEVIPKGTIDLANSLTTNLTSATKAIQNAGSDAGKTAKEFSEFGKVSEKALGVLKSDLDQAKQKLQSFSTTNATPQDIAKAQAEVDKLEKEVVQAEQAFDGFKQQTSKANEQLNDTSSASNKAQAGFSALKTGATLLVSALAAVGIGLGIKELATAADSYANLSARIQQTTKDGGDFNSAIAGVHQVALLTNSSLETTAELFTKLNTVSKDMGMSQQQALDLTKTVTQAIKLGGSSVQGAEAAVTQFIQAMQGGVLRGEEFNSMMENGYGLAEALAKGLGVTTGELRKMAENGELGAERVLKALESQKGAIEASYNQLPNTIGNALQKISTSWQILIGEMDQANGSSIAVADALTVIADNLGILKLFFDDIGDGIGWFQSQLDSIDHATIDAIQEALAKAYQTIKDLIANVGELGKTTWSAFNSALDAVSPLFAAFLSGGENVSGLTTLMNLLQMAMSAVSDVAFGLNIGLKTILASIQFLTGGIAALSSSVLGFIGFDDLAQQAQNASDRLFAQAEQNMQDATKLAQEHKWAIVETYNEIGKTEAEKNADRIANNQKALVDISAQEQKHVADYKVISDERIKLNQQLVDARKSGDQSAIDAAMAGLNELQKREQAYQSESEKLTEAKILAAQAVANATIKSADAAGQATLKALNAQLAAQGLKAEFDSAGKVIVSSMEVAVKETEELGTTAEQSATKVRKAASALEIDLDAALNRVSNKFKETERSVNDLAAELENTGVTGQEASEVLYLGWSKWLATAKSQAEIDIAKAKLQEFQEQGVFSTKQVEMGMLAIKQATAKLPDDLDEVGKAFDRLGIKTKEQLKLAAESAIADFNTMKASGQATSEGLKQAYERVMQAAAASGDQAVISNAKAQGASVGLQAQIDATGKSSVQSTQEIVDGLYNVGETARGSAAQGFRGLGRVAREEAQSTADEWAAAMKKVDAERKAQAASSAKGLGQAMDDMNAKVADYEKRLIAAGMNAGEARSKAQESKDAMYFAYQKALQSGSVIDYSAPLLKKMDDTLAYWEGKKSGSGGSSISVGGNAPAVPVPNIQAPSIEYPKMPNIPDAPSSPNITYKIQFDGQEVEFQGDPSQQSLVNELFNQLEQAKKRM